jgi:hypothetical protein
MSQSAKSAVMFCLLWGKYTPKSIRQQLFSSFKPGDKSKPVYNHRHHTSGKRQAGRWFRRLFDEAFWIGLEGVVEGFLAGCVDLVGLTIVDLVRRHQADASMVMIPIIPIEEATSERLCVLDAAEPLRKLRLIF